MLRTEHDIHLGAIRQTGGEKLAEDRFGQRTVHGGLQHIRIAEKRDRSAVQGPGIDVVGRALLDDLAVAHQRNFIGHAHRLIGLMGDEQDGGVFFFQDAQGLVPDAVAQAVIETGEGFIHQHDARLRGQRTGQRHSLLLTAGKLVRVAVDVAQ